MSEPEPWTRIYNRVKATIPAATDAVIRQEIFAVMIDFTSDTNIWVEEFPFVTDPNTVDYVMPVIQGVANRLVLVYDAATEEPYNWADNYITMRIPGTIHLTRSPTEAKNWVARIAKSCNTDKMDAGTPPKPTGYPEVDDWIVNQNNDAIYYGTLWYLQRQPAKPYRDPTAARENQLMYGSAKSQVRVNNMRQNVFGGQAWQYPQSFATISRKGWS